MKNKVFAMIIGTVIALATVSVIIDASSETASAASPYAPTDLEVDLGDKEITLKWKAPADSDPDGIYYVVYKNGSIETRQVRYLFTLKLGPNMVQSCRYLHGEGGRRPSTFPMRLP